MIKNIEAITGEHPLFDRPTPHAYYKGACELCLTYYPNRSYAFYFFADNRE